MAVNPSFPYRYERFHVASIAVRCTKNSAVLRSFKRFENFELESKGVVVRKTTLAAIAVEAGVSLPTVSKVVNGRPDVAPSTRARVEQLLDQHKYPRNGQRAAAPLRADRPGVQRAGQPVGGRDPARRRGLGRRALHRDRGVLGPARRRPPGELDVGDRQPSLRRGDPGHHHADRLAGRPAAAGRASRSSSSTRRTPRRRTSRQSARRTGRAAWPPPSTCCRSATGGSAAITGADDMLCSLARLDGYRSALERAGIAVDSLLVRYGDFQHEGGFAHAIELLDLPDRPTGDLRGQRPAGVRRLPGRTAAAACAFPTTCRSSASTNCPSAAGPRRR